MDMVMEARAPAKATPLVGCLDRFVAPATVCGWVDTHGQRMRGHGIIVRVRRNGRIIAAGPLSQPRVDIVPDESFVAGFHLTCDEEIPDEAFAFGQLTVEAVDRAGNTSTLPIYDRARCFALERVLAASQPFGTDCAAVLLAALTRSPAIPPEPKQALRNLNDQHFEDADRKLLHDFESLGRDCSLGSVQRAFGAEPLGLLRFSGIGADAVPRVLNSRFAGVGTAEFTRLITDEQGEYYTQDTRYHMSTHTYVYEGKVDRDDFFRKQCQKITYLVGNMIEKLETGDRVFVIHDLPETLPSETLRAVLAAMRQYGNAPLLYLAPADAMNPVGKVEHGADGYLTGYVERIQGELMKPEWQIREGWINTLRRAHGLAFGGR